MPVEPADNSEAITAALQLLLGDKDTGYKRRLINKAFPDEFMIFLNGEQPGAFVLTDTITLLKAIADQNDGSSPLGRLAQEQVRTKAKSAQLYLKTLAMKLGVDIK